MIGSLFGNHRVVDPVMPVDEEKLQRRPGDAGRRLRLGDRGHDQVQVRQGRRRLRQGGQGHRRRQVDRGGRGGVPQPGGDRRDHPGDGRRRRPSSRRSPTPRSTAMMKAFAEPAMSGLVTVKTDTGVSLPLEPAELPVEVPQASRPSTASSSTSYDLTALKELYGGHVRRRPDHPGHRQEDGRHPPGRLCRPAPGAPEQDATGSASSRRTPAERHSRTRGHPAPAGCPLVVCHRTSA